MSLMRRLFGPSRDEVWSQLARRMEGEFQRGTWLKTSVVRVEVAPWTVTLDTFTRSNGKSASTYTRLRAPYINPDGFRFQVYRASIFSGIAELFGTQDVRVGDPTFDEGFVVKSTDENRIRDLLVPELREQLMSHPRLNVQVKDDEGWFGTRFPEGVDELYFETIGVVKDLDFLKSGFDLFADILHRLCELGSAYEEAPDLALRS